MAEIWLSGERPSKLVHTTTHKVGATVVILDHTSSSSILLRKFHQTPRPNQALELDKLGLPTQTEKRGCVILPEPLTQVRTRPENKNTSCIGPLPPNTACVHILNNCYLCTVGMSEKMAKRNDLGQPLAISVSTLHQNESATATCAAAAEPTHEDTSSLKSWPNCYNPFGDHTK